METARQSCLPTYSSTLGGVKNCSLQAPPQTHWGRRLGDCLARFSLLDTNLCVQGCAPQAYIHIRHCSFFPLTNLEGTVPISSIVGGIIPHHSPLLNIESHHTTQGALELSLETQASPNSKPSCLGLLSTGIIGMCASPYPAFPRPPPSFVMTMENFKRR